MFKNDSLDNEIIIAALVSYYHYTKEMIKKCYDSEILKIEFEEDIDNTLQTLTKYHNEGYRIGDSEILREIDERANREDM